MKHQLKTSSIISLLLRLFRKPSALQSFRKFVQQYPVEELVSKATKGRQAIFPLSELDEFGKAILGAPIYLEAPLRYDTLEKILIVPPLYTPLRLKKMEDLMREPLFTDVETTCTIGGFSSSLPVAVASMGSTPVYNKISLAVSKASAKIGIPIGIGENVATVWGYSKRVKPSQPCFKERIMAYLDNLRDGFGGVFIQQSVEDAYDELWNRVYSDPDITPYIYEGKVAFEVKLGQGAKPGLGGETFVERETALRLSEKYSFDADPKTTNKQMYERHSAPGTYTPEILRSMIRLLHNNYPRAKIWIKFGPYRDLADVAALCDEEKVDAFWVDGKEGGTGLSPVTALKDLGLPLLAVLGKISRLKQRVDMDFICSGRIIDGGDAVKVLCFGAFAGIGRPVVVAAYANGGDGVEKYFEALKTEIQLLTSAVGKYRLQDLGLEDVAAVDRQLALDLGIRSVYD
ncbi:MAG: glutamate synthase-related protein [Candidatus Caldarchaeum sp.]|nr:glutamate synthase-related protein [Candidatus Caldarchaeum sp.]MCS7133388.1 glutamate synthase-related protein [Candidatus Caldarchaeum sp.]MDW8063392.1 glutamate synthase-related protein [Candidatus Caldarchaeum sp.]MDW8435619.1 glutamate synthase-related protein [Candidatus Caldarchaeum sp.]